MAQPGVGREGRQVIVSTRLYRASSIAVSPAPTCGILSAYLRSYNEEQSLQGLFFVVALSHPG
ncbi:MAG: hypothetical protein IPG34_09035 [Rhodocyclaceae bacterium]|nr:hypothetical protein [Rhodocyclaceae bacterium]